MIKREELSNPASCLNRARDDEFVFVLLGRDAATPGTLRFWVEERIRLGKNQRTDLQLEEAERDAARLLKEQGRPTEMDYRKAAAEIIERVVEGAIRCQFTRQGLDGVEADGQILNEDEMVRDAVNLALGEDTGCLGAEDFHPGYIDVLFVEQKLKEASIAGGHFRER